MTICTKCNENKNDEDFYKRKNGKLYSWCKQCTKSANTTETRLAYRNKDREKYRKLKRESRHRNIETYLLKNARLRAKRNNWDFNLTKEDIVVPAMCPVLNIPIKFEAEFKDNHPSLDRIDNTKGYVKGNVIVVSYRVNRIKRDATLEELQKINERYNEIINGKNPQIEI